MKILDLFLGVCTLEAEGTFPERIINIAKENYIFIRNISIEETGKLTFSVSRRGYRYLSALPLPENLSLSLVKEYGFSTFFNKNKHRYALVAAPIIGLLLLFLSTCFIWNVNVIDADPETEKRILNELEDMGVKRGALKFTIDQKKVKNEILIKDPSLSWIWVDIKGSAAIVRYADRTPVPSIFNEAAFCNVYSSSDAVITRISTTNGTPVVKVGDTVLKGELLIEGTRRKSEEEVEFVHASGEVYGLCWEEKTLSFPNKTQIRTPTGKNYQRLSINFEKFLIKLFINSSILYPEYDIIEYNRSIPYLPVTFIKEEIAEVSVSYKDNDTNLLAEKEKEAFCSLLSEKGFLIKDTAMTRHNLPDSTEYTLKVLCEKPIATERRINIGENTTGTDS